MQRLEEVDGAEYNESCDRDGRDAEEEVAPCLRRLAGEEFHHGFCSGGGFRVCERWGVCGIGFRESPIKCVSVPQRLKPRSFCDVSRESEIGHSFELFDHEAVHLVYGASAVQDSTAGAALIQLETEHVVVLGGGK